MRLGGRGLGPEHVLHDLALADFSGDEGSDVTAVAKHGCAIAHRDHLGEAVRDEQNRSTAAAPILHHGEDPLREIGRQRRRDLVEQQKLRIACHRSREIDHPQERQGHVARLFGEVDVDVHLAQPLPHRIHVHRGEANVLRDGEIWHERRILEHRRQADPCSPRRRRDANGLATQIDGAAIPLDDARQDLDERALAGAVGPEERVHLTGVDGETRRLERDDRAVALSDVACLEQAHPSPPGHPEGAPRRRPFRSLLCPTAPCS